jgi:hypothetical protein
MGIGSLLAKLIPFLPQAVTALTSLGSATTTPKPVPFNEKHQWENIDAGPPVVVLSKPYCVYCGETRTPQNKDEKCLGARPKTHS